MKYTAKLAKCSLWNKSSDVIKAAMDLIENLDACKLPWEEANQNGRRDSVLGVPIDEILLESPYVLNPSFDYNDHENSWQIYLFDEPKFLEIASFYQLHRNPVGIRDFFDNHSLNIPLGVFETRIRAPKRYGEVDRRDEPLLIPPKRSPLAWVHALNDQIEPAPAESFQTLDDFATYYDKQIEKKDFGPSASLIYPVLKNTTSNIRDFDSKFHYHLLTH